jgi:putative heme-binding domain-containing protein
LTNTLAQSRDAGTRLDAVRLIILALGDWHLKDPPVEVFTAYQSAAPVPELAQSPEFARLIRRLVTSPGTSNLDLEASRLLAMIEDRDGQTPQQLASFLTEASSATLDFHYLACIARLKGPITELAPRLAHAVLILDRKLAGQGMRVKQNWDVRLAEVVGELTRREPAMTDAIVRHPLLAQPAHVALALALPEEQREAVARRFFNAVRANRSFPWSPRLLDLFAELPPDELFPLLRAQWANAALRDGILLQLSAAPAVVDRQRFLAGLDSTQSQVVRASLSALLKLPPDLSGANLVPPVRLLHRLLEEPPEQLARAQVVALLSAGLKQSFKIDEPAGGDTDALKAAYQPVLDFITARYPGVITAMHSADTEDPARWMRIIRSLAWEGGDPGRGQRVFIERGCAACHVAEGAIGPDISPAVRRMSREDLMFSIVFPSRDIAPPYRATTFTLRNGERVAGIVAFESADGWIVHTGAGNSVRMSSADVVSRQPGHVSLMPAGLLEGLTPVALADLYSFLRTIGNEE